MKKIILSATLMIASLTGLSAMAQTSDNGSAKCPTKKECTNKKDCKMRAPKHANPFEGLNLTDAQKSALEALRPNKEACKQMKEHKGLKNKEDKKNLTPEQRKQMRTQMMEERKAKRQDYLNKVKSILTPEQYVTFLENNFINKDMKKGPKGPKFHGKERKGFGKDLSRAHNHKMVKKAA